MSILTRFQPVANFDLRILARPLYESAFPSSRDTHDGDESPWRAGMYVVIEIALRSHHD